MHITWQTLDEFLQAAVENGFPSAQIWVAQGEEVLFSKAYGYTDYSRNTRVTPHTLYDVASLTKIFVTTYLWQWGVSQQAWDVDAPLETYFSEYNLRPSIAQITARDLLSHCAGFAANPLYYDPLYSTDLYCQSRALLIEKLLITPQVFVPRQQHCYSDVDFMLLTFILEKLGKKRLDVLAEEVFWQPLELNNITFTPLAKGYSAEHIAATELQGNTRDLTVYFPNIRTSVVHGEVQDEKAFHCMAGISGHAGLFASAEAIGRLLNLMRMPQAFWTTEAVRPFLQPCHQDQTFGLGWRLNRHSSVQYLFGEHASKISYGHTGWTGCVAFYDPSYDLRIVYLTNRKHTAVVDPRQDLHQFIGDNLPAGKYRNIINTIYAILGIV